MLEWAVTAHSTAEVTRATIINQVSSSGAVSAGASENLGFAKGGRLTSLKVKVGHHVTTGQVLAKMDTYAARQVLKQQRPGSRSCARRGGRRATSEC
jgi:HlyD family secretion protein